MHILVQNPSTRYQKYFILNLLHSWSFQGLLKIPQKLPSLHRMILEKPLMSKVFWATGFCFFSDTSCLNNLISDNVSAISLKICPCCTRVFNVLSTNFEINSDLIIYIQYNMFLHYLQKYNIAFILPFKMIFYYWSKIGHKGF